MHSKVIIGGVLSLSILSLFASPAQVHAKNVSVVATCNVQVTIKATVPDSVEQGKSFNVTNITVQPANTYGFNVTSSIYTFTATNTSSSSYIQNFYATNPSPTTGKNTYIGYYPNWAINATGAVGSAVTLTIVKSVTVIQGYGGSPVTCNFSKVLATIPITAPAPAPSSSPQPSSQPSSAPPSSGGSSSSGSTRTTTSTGSKSTSSSTQKSGTETNTPSPSSSPEPRAAGSTSQPDDESVSVIPLNIEVKDSTGKIVQGAEVTLDNTKKLMTDSDGRVVFSNVLTGSHVVLVSYKDLKTNKTIKLTTADVGGVVPVSLPAAQGPSPVVIAAAGAGAAGVLGLGAFLVIRRKRELARAAAAAQSGPAITVSGIVDGTAIAAPGQAVISHVPAVPVFAATQSAPAPAPWEPTPVAPAAPVAPVANAPAVTIPPSDPMVYGTKPIAQQTSPEPVAVAPAPVIATPEPVVAPTPVATVPLEQPLPITAPEAAHELPKISKFATMPSPMNQPAASTPVAPAPAVIPQAPAVQQPQPVAPVQPAQLQTPPVEPQPPAQPIVPTTLPSAPVA